MSEPSHSVGDEARVVDGALRPRGAQQPLAAETIPAAGAGAVPVGAADEPYRGYRPEGLDRNDRDVAVEWEGRTRIFLTPLAAPSIIGLFGFMGATLMVGAWQAGWYGNAATPAFIFPFAVMFGGLLQAGAAFPALRARDGLAAAVHATWGAFWLGYGLLFGLVVAGLLPAVPLGVANPNFAMWFVVLTLITTMCAIAATFHNFNIAAVLWTLAAGSGLTAAGLWGGDLAVTRVGGWLFVISAAIAWYAASAMVLENTIGRTVLPIFRPKAAAMIPGRRATIPIEYPQGMPGVRVGQ